MVEDAPAPGRRKSNIASRMTAGVLLGSEGGVRMPQRCAYFIAPFSQARNVRLRSLSNDSLAAVLMISATEIEARALRHCVSASRKAFAIAQGCLNAAGAAAHGLC